MDSRAVYILSMMGFLISKYLRLRRQISTFSDYDLYTSRNLLEWNVMTWMFWGGGEEMTTRARIWPLADLSTLYTKVLGFDLMKRRKYSYRHIIGQQQPPARNRQSSRCVSYITHTARQYLIYKPQARWWWWGPGERARAHWATCNIRFLLLHHLLTAEDDRKLYLQKTIFFFFFFFFQI